MKCMFRSQCLPARKNAPYEAEDIVLTMDMPFIPVAGMKLKLTADSDYYPVDDVFWDATVPDQVEVFLDDAYDGAPLPAWSEMKRQGWRKE